VSNKDPEVKTKCTNLAVVKVEEDVLSTLEARMSNWHALRRLVGNLAYMETQKTDRH